MKKLASLGGVAGGGIVGLAVAAVLAGQGHADGRVRVLPPAVTPAAALAPMADLTDVYGWVTGSNLNLVMDVSPQDDGSHSFDPSVLYVFHLTSKKGLGLGFGTSGGTETDVLCRFGSNTSVECWVTSAGSTRDYVTGDPSNPAGVASIRGKIKVFAGRRSDPSSFNLAGFNAAIPMFTRLISTTTPDLAGCPSGAGTQPSSLRTTLATGSDSFAASNVMAIVVQVDKSLVNVDPNTVVAVWASTHAGQ